MQQTAASIATAYDPSSEVPTEYDVFCEACGYSLLGLTSDRCPECGVAYEALGIPFARIPWLHRRRIGFSGAYVRTVAMILLHPREFVAELCRPVRISAADARRFRIVTIHMAALVIVLAAAVPVAMELWQQMGRGVTVYEIIMAVGMLMVYMLGVGAAAEAFLRLATDMPVFIWKGLPTMQPHQLAPVHHYASAPLALMPLVAMAAGAYLYQMQSVGSGTITTNAVAAAVLLLLAMLCWVIPLVLMRGAGNPRRRVLLMALYLPAHWFLVGAVTWLAVIAILLGSASVLQSLGIHLRL